jgi:hypothetical protein
LLTRASAYVGAQLLPWLERSGASTASNGVRLHGQMKMPRRLWLQFEARGSGRSTSPREPTIFDAAGYVRRAHWYALYPVHRWVFRLLRGMSRAVQRELPVG